MCFHWLIHMEMYTCRGRFSYNLEYDWLMMMPLEGTAVRFYPVTLQNIR